MRKCEQRILTTHVGSLPRPPQLLEAMANASPECDEILRRSVRDGVRKQVGVGIDIPSDGEFGKSSWSEYHAIIDAGLTLQVDDAVLANMYDHLVQTGPQRYRKWAQLRIDALNHALEGIPQERVRYHVCFGSWHVPHMADAPLEELVDFIVQVRAGAYSFEAANPRHEHEAHAS